MGPELARESAYLDRTIVTLWHMANKVTEDKQADVHLAGNVELSGKKS